MVGRFFCSKHAARLQEKYVGLKFRKVQSHRKRLKHAPPVFAETPATKNMTTSLRSWGENSWRKLLHMLMHSLKINQESRGFSQPRCFFEGFHIHRSDFKDCEKSRVP